MLKKKEHLFFLLTSVIVTKRQKIILSYNHVMSI